ncbi:MAG: hypothetical protein H7145_11120 [Akkermansiaceae bacterium]|nr:hypothetical protein [Armatimonadota bacterium]
MDAGILALMIPFAGIGIAALAIYLAHVRKIAEIHARVGAVENRDTAGNVNVSSDVRAELQALREEVAILRDTSTKFDLSFDAGLTRLEDRVARVEEQNYAARSTVTSADEPAVLTARSR